MQPASEGLEKTVSELKNSGADLRAIIDTSPALVCCGLPDGSKEFLNKQWRDYTGLPLEESYRWGWQVTVRDSHRNAGTRPSNSEYQVVSWLTTT